jgi:putative transcriptional regulator
MTERNLFEELKNGLDDVVAYEQGKRTLKTTELTPRQPRTLSAKEIRDIREKYNMSRAVFAHFLHISPRTLEKWEQGTTRPNDQASTLIALADKYPDMFERLEAIV